MAIPVSVSPTMATRRSTQSGDKAMTAGYTAIYTESSTAPWIFVSADIDLTDMQAGDSIDIRIRKIMEAGGAYIVYESYNYLNAQPATKLVCNISSMYNIYGLEIAMRQTAGTLRTITCEFIDAKRLGL